jgi:hypothetical protein
MQHDIITLCHSAMDTGKGLSILGAFNEIHVQGFPHHFPPFALACRLRFRPDEAGDHELKMTVGDPDGRVLGQMVVSFRVDRSPVHPEASLAIVFPVFGMDIHCAGEHMIDLILDGGPELRMPLYVVKIS